MRLEISAILWALFVTGSIGTSFLGLAQGWNPAWVLFVQVVLTYAILALCEIFWPRRREWGWSSDWQVLTDIGHGFLSDLIARNLLALAVIYGVGSVTPLSGLGWRETPAFIVLGVIVIEGLDYTCHRLMHRFDLLWPFHALHHHPDRMHIFRAGRIHAVNAIARALLVFLPALLLGIPESAITAWLICINALGPIGHANVKIETPFFLNRLLTTPMVHRVHHANEERMMRSNLAPLLPVFDILFRTWQAPEISGEFDVGISDDFFPKGFIGQIVAPFRQILRTGRG